MEGWLVCIILAIIIIYLLIRSTKKHELDLREKH